MNPVKEDGPHHVPAPEEADGAGLPGADPPGLAVLVQLQPGGGEHKGGVAEPQGPVQVPVEVLRGRVPHSRLPDGGQADHPGLLGHHVHGDVGGQALFRVDEPLEEVPVLQGGHPDGTALVVDLGVVVGHLELADHVRQLAQLPVPQPAGGGFVQHGDLVKGDLLDLRGEVPGVHRQQVPVGPCPEDGGGDDLPDDENGGQGQDDDHHRLALTSGKGEVGLEPHPLGAGVHPQGDHEHQDIHQQQHQHEAVEAGVVEVQGGE